MIKINNLTKYYDKVLAVENLNLHIKKGEIFGFIGPNGSGKSTTIRAILKFINKTEGEILVNGINTDISEDYKDDIGYLPSEINLYKNFKVKEMFEYASCFYKKDCNKKLEYLINTLEIDTNKKISELSFGNLKKVGIAIALMHDPKILILDEPTNGLDPLKQKEFFDILIKEKEKGTTIFLSSHNLEEVKKVCDRVGIIKNGKIIEIKEVKELINDNYQIVTLKTKNKINLENKQIISKENNEIKFIYNENLNDLIKELSSIKIEYLTIEQPSLEQIFMHYYEGDKND